MTICALVLTSAMVLAGCTSSTQPASGSSDAAEETTEEAGEAEEASGETVNIKMATGGTSGTYYAYGGILSTLINGKDAGLNINIHSSGASKANIFEIVDGEADVAFVQNDVMDYAYNGTNLFEEDGAQEGFSTVAALYSEVCQVVASPDITDISELAGKNVSVGDAGSGTEFNAQQILAAYGIDMNSDIKKQNLGFGDSATAYQDGKVDAFFVTAGTPTSALTELATQKDYVILSIDDEHADALIADYPFYAKYEITGDTYSVLAGPVQTVAVKATLVASNDLSEEAVYNLCKVIFDNKAEIAENYPKGAELDQNYAVDGMSVPFHPGAQKYFEEAGVLK